MGRHVKVIEKDNIDRRELGYYFTPAFVANYISNRLLILKPDGDKVLDPCVGKEELLETFFARGKQVDGIDVFRHKENYKCHFIQRDFVAFYEETKRNAEHTQLTMDDLLKESHAKAELDYDYIIANPPYNCHEVDYIKNNKTALKNLFDDVGVHNMYSMFLSAIIDVAKEGAVIGLITYDSFFTAKAHTDLRRKILQECTIHEITMCPIDLFHEQDADVRTSIIILQKGKKFQEGISIANRPSNKKVFQAQLARQLEDHKTVTARPYALEDIILTNPNDNDEFIIECPDDIKVLFSEERLGEAFKCVTGISTGKDELYLSKERKDPFTIPFYKNPGKNRFYTGNQLYLHKDFLKFDKEIKNFMVRNKPLLFQPGITCSSMGVAFTACRLPENATYGVNANIICEDEDAWWLLAYLNSDLVTYLVRGVMIRSNMITSGYVSRIPLLRVEEAAKSKLGEFARTAHERAREGKSFQDVLENINDFVYKQAGISNETIAMIKRFNEDLIANT